jgi:hypothetical protein
MSCQDHSPSRGPQCTLAAPEALAWPFEPLRSASPHRPPWVALHGPVLTAEQHAQFAALRRAGARLLGVMSYLDFPRADPRDGFDYPWVCEAWCHCLRRPGELLPAAVPAALVSASDFTDWRWIARARAGATCDIAVDIIYVGAAEPWQQRPKGWALAAHCLPLLVRELGLRALVIGRPDATLAQQPGIAFRAALPWPELLAAIAGARMLFAPNADDPSPRVLAEALCLDRPLLVNAAILGGWKYVTPYTGAFFAGAHDVVDAARSLLAAPLAPLDWFRANFGPEVAGRRLARLLEGLDPALRGQSLQLSPAGPARARPAA